MPAPILFVDHAQRLGGAEHSLLLLMQHLDKTVWQPHLACPAGDLAEAAQQLGVPCHYLPLPRLRRSVLVGLDWFQNARKLALLANKLEVRAIVANTVRAAFYSSLAAKLCKRPFLWHMRDFWLSEAAPRYRQIDTLLKKALCAAATQVIVNSAATAKHLPCGNVTIIHNGLDLGKFSVERDGNPFRQAYGIPKDAPLIGIVGRLRPWKGQHRFIKMAATVSPTHPNAIFVIVGGFVFEFDNGYADFLRGIAQQRQLEKKVHFTGHLADVRDALAAMDIFVHSGDPEPFGLVNIEAMATGKPVVAFAHGALPEIVQHEATGLLVPPADEMALANGVSTLITNPEYGQQLGIAGRARVEELFTIQQTAVKFSSVLQNSVASRS
ncbi:glycosyltransferase family 4 protein [Candidatus Leptofilum sp.]|uniref:glycosyltransferase family 4 protein n=1 Tax=Candidatus Leptofilum sp. TaxID=3241576 RepID=UPI003B5B45F6